MPDWLAHHHTASTGEGDAVIDGRRSGAPGPPRRHRQQQGVAIRRDRPAGLAADFPHPPHPAQTRRGVHRRHPGPRPVPDHTGSNAHQIAADLLASDKSGAPHDVLTGLIGPASEARAHVLTLGVVLAAYEAATSVQSWHTVQVATSRYLTYLDECGYTLSDVERRACGQDPLPASDEPDEQ